MSRPADDGSRQAGLLRRHCTGNASRVLFLVDRLELEEQARKAFTGRLSADYSAVIYKESRDD